MTSARVASSVAGIVAIVATAIRTPSDMPVRTMTLVLQIAACIWLIALLATWRGTKATERQKNARPEVRDEAQP